MINSFEIKRWCVFAIASLFFFLIVGSTYGSLGVILPAMLAELGWSWTQAGLGFTILALMTGITSLIPAWVLRRFNIKAAYIIGGLCMCCGFILLATCKGLIQFYVATALLGYGFTHCANVPGVHLLNNWMPDKRALAIGTYMAIGGLGGVAGPLLVTAVDSATGSWRMYWWIMTAVMFILTMIAALFIKDQPADLVAESEAVQEVQKATELRSPRVYKTSVDWTYKEVVRSPQFYVIVAAMTMTLFCTVTMSSWAVVHMGTLGVSMAIAATALSTQALLNALSRAFGGMVATRIDPRWLLLSALVAHLVGMIGLSIADTPLMIALFVIGEGYGYGMCLFATTMLLINYFGPTHNPEVLGTLNLITTVAMIGPLLTGFVADTFGSFAIVFQSYAFFLLIIAVAVFLMRPPQKKNPSRMESVPADS